MSTNLILTTGVYDLIKDHIRRRKVTKDQEEILTDALKNAKQILRKDLPENIVTVNRKVKIKDITTNEEIVAMFVAPSKAKPMKKKLSILSDIGLATIGRPIGDVVEWPTILGNKSFQVLEIETLS